MNKLKNYWGYNTLNIQDFDNPKKLLEKCRLAAIMERQRGLMEKYHHIESASGLMQTDSCPVDLHCKKGQARLKDFSWRITEELMEALEAYKAGDTEHFEEELIDALHFMMEQHILIGFYPISYLDYLGTVTKAPSPCMLDICYAHLPIKPPSSIEDLMLEVIESLGLAMNCLKNKPWKQTHMLTDIHKFRMLMASTFLNFLCLTKEAGLSTDDIYNLYYRKSKVNSFRQESQY